MLTHIYTILLQIAITISMYHKRFSFESLTNEDFYTDINYIFIND